jgi:hypothetical protein
MGVLPPLFSALYYEGKGVAVNSGLARAAAAAERLAKYAENG